MTSNGTPIAGLIGIRDLFWHRAGKVLWAIILVTVHGLHATAPPNYYDTATGKSGSELKGSLHEIIKGHTSIPFEDTFTPLRDIFEDPTQTSNLILLHSRDSIPKFASWSREHLWPRSRGNADHDGPDDSDLFNLAPTIAAVNSLRGNLIFDNGNTLDPEYRLPATSLAPQTTLDSDSWEPPPGIKGDIARSLFYMAVRYDGDEPATTDLELVSIPPIGPQMGNLNTLLLWHEIDPVDDRERTRNDLIFSTYQGNRNPFIDEPQWVTDI